MRNGYGFSAALLGKRSAGIMSGTLAMSVRGHYLFMDTFLRNNLKLTMHPDKIFMKTAASGVDFLGWVHFPDHRVLRTATKRRMIKRIAAHPTQETIISYAGLLKHGNTRGLRGKYLPDGV